MPLVSRTNGETNGKPGGVCHALIPGEGKKQKGSHATCPSGTRTALPLMK